MVCKFGDLWCVCLSEMQINSRLDVNVDGWTNRGMENDTKLLLFFFFFFFVSKPVPEFPDPLYMIF